MQSAESDMPVAEAPRSRAARVPKWAGAVVAAGVSGTLMAFCFEPFNLHALAWIALVPWLWALTAIGPGRAWLAGTLLGLVYYRIGMGWVFGLNGPIGGGVIVILAVWMGFSFRVARMLMERFGRKAMLWAVPLTFVGQEVIRCEGLPRLRLPFLAMGYSQAGDSYAAQLVSIGGVYGLSAMIVLVNASLAYGLAVHRRRAWWPAVGAVVATAALAWFGRPAVSIHATAMPVACVQAETFKTDIYVDLTRRAIAEGARLVVLPEHALVNYPDERSPVVQKLANMAGEADAYICFGAHAAALKGAGCPFDNVAMLVGPSRPIEGRQAKCVPLPFFQDGNPAGTQNVMEASIGRLGVLICFDALFTDHARRLVEMGAELLVVPVMDVEAWPEQERRQHAAMAPFRSIELRRCAVRAASSGISQIIDTTGRVTAARQRAEGAGVLSGTIYLNEERTWFVRGGHIFAPATAIAFLAAIGWLTLSEWFARIARWIGRRKETAPALS